MRRGTDLLIDQIMMMMKNPTIAVLLLTTVFINSFAQKKTKPMTCKPSALAAFKPLPKLKYGCTDDPTESDEKLLKRPERQQAIKILERRLERFTNPAWWQAIVDDLNLCELHRKPGVLSKDEQERVRIGDYPLDLFGNHSLRLALLPDPCYQTGYGGSNAFLLYRQAGGVFVTEVFDGFFSRAANPMGMDVGDLMGQKVIEISTSTGGLHPSVTNYYFVIDPKTHKAVPKKIFRGDKSPTNEISSDLLMADPADLGLPIDATELNIIRGHKLAPSFSIYAEDEEGEIESPRGKMKRSVLRWNGRIYQ